MTKGQLFVELMHVVWTHVKSNTCMQGPSRYGTDQEGAREARATLSVLLSSSTELRAAENSKSNPAFWVIRIMFLSRLLLWLNNI